MTDESSLRRQTFDNVEALVKELAETSEAVKAVGGDVAKRATREEMQVALTAVNQAIKEVVRSMSSVSPSIALC